MKLLLLLAALLLSPACFAQLYAYHVGGEVYLKTSSRSVLLRPRAAVAPHQALLLKPGAQVVLFDQTGHNITYSKAGVATYAALQAAFAASAAGPTQAYLAYVWQSLNRQTTTAPRGSAPLGAVSRGDAPPLLAPADSAVLDQPVVTFRWQAPAPAASWFTLTDAGHDPVLQISLTGSTLELNSLLTRLKRHTVYYWTVSATPESAANAPRRAFVLVNTGEVHSLTQELASLPVAAETAGWQRALRTGWFFQRAEQTTAKW